MEPIEAAISMDHLCCAVDKLLKHRTTPQKALELLETCPSPDAFNVEEEAISMEHLCMTVNKLLKHSTTPQKALQLLETCPPPDAFNVEDEGPFVIIQSFFLFIVHRHPSNEQVVGLKELKLHQG